MDIENFIGHSIPKREYGAELLSEIEPAQKPKAKLSKTRKEGKDKKPREKKRKDAKSKKMDSRKPVSPVPLHNGASDEKSNAKPSGLASPPSNRFSKRFGEMPLVG